MVLHPPRPLLTARVAVCRCCCVRCQTEAAYSKIMESSQTLLHVLKRESVNLTKKKQASDGV